MANTSGDAWRQEFLRDLSAIRNKGRAANLSDEQIDDLFYRSNWIKKTSATRVFFRQMIKTFKYMVYGLAMVVCFIVVLNQFPFVFNAFETYLNIDGYNVTRVSRHFAIRTGLQMWMAEKEWDKIECFLDNPLYLAPKPPCSVECHNASLKEYRQIHDDELRKIKYRYSKDLFTYRSPAASGVSLTNIKEMLLPHSEEVVKRTVVSHSTVKGFEFIDDLLNAPNPEELLEDAEQALVVIGTSHYNVSRHFRSLFPRAPFVPLEDEVQLEKKLYVYQNGKKIHLKDNREKQAWIHQARGTYCYFVRQLNECTKKEKKKLRKDNTDGAEELIDGGKAEKNGDAESDFWKSCPTFSFRLEQGDFAYINGYFWKGEARPCENQEVVSASDEKGKIKNLEVEKGEKLMSDGGSDKLVGGKDYGLIYVGRFN